MTHQSENEREKYACKFCDKTLYYTASIRKHVQLCHSMIFTSLGSNSKVLSNTIRRKEEKLYLKTKEEISPIPQIQRKSNCATGDKELNKFKVIIKFKQKDTQIPKDKLPCKEVERSNLIVSESIPKLEKGLDQSIKEAQGENSATSSTDQITNEKVIEEEKKVNPWEIYDMFGDNVERVYLHSGMSSDIPIIDYSTLDCFMKNDINYSFVLENPEIFHYEYLIL